eukprot:2582777-Pleurochrysis_carterae.AAC.1
MNGGSPPLSPSPRVQVAEPAAMARRSLRAVVHRRDLKAACFGSDIFCGCVLLQISSCGGIRYVASHISLTESLKSVSSSLASTMYYDHDGALMSTIDRIAGDPTMLLVLSMRIATDSALGMIVL